MSGNSDKEVEELPRLINLSTMSEFDNYHFAKSTLISESFHFGSNLPKLVPKPRPYPPREKMLRVLIWHPFLEILAKVKSFQRLSHREGNAIFKSGAKLKEKDVVAKYSKNQ